MRKRRASARQVGTAKASGSEPLMTCRNSLVDIETGVELLPRDEPGGYLSTALAVARHRGGASPVQALARNVGTPRRDGAGWRVDAGWREGEPRAAETVRGRVLMRGRGTDRLVVVMKAL